MNHTLSVDALPNANYLYLIGVLLPPTALNVFGEYLGERMVDTPYGPVGPLAQRGGHGRNPCWIQPYSGLPTRTDPRATLYAARALGVSSILSWDRGRALNPVLQLGQSLFVQDYIDNTKHLTATFLADEDDVPPSTDLDSTLREVTNPLRQHYDPSLLPLLQNTFASQELSLPGLIYLGLDGPRYETAAEARMYRMWGADVIGHNLIPDVFLAKELAISFTGVVTITTFGSDRPQPGSSRAATSEITTGIEQTAYALAQLTKVDPIDS